MINSIGGIEYAFSASGGMQPAPPSQEAMSSRFQDVFGADALTSVQNADGTMNVGKVKDFIQDQGISGVSDSTGAGSLLLNQSQLGNFNTEAVLDRFASRFGEDAASSISNGEGGIDFTKMGEFIQSHRNGATPEGLQALSETHSTAIADRISRQFGEDAIAQVTDSEGNIDPGKVKDFMMEKIQSGEIQPPMGGGFGAGATGGIPGFGGSQQTELFDTLLSTLSAEDDSEDTILSLYV